MRKLFLLLMALCMLSAKAQINTQRMANATLRSKADSLFVAAKFSDALPLFQDLLEKFPREVNYQYALGVCYLHATRSMDLAVKHLTQASKGEIPAKGYYYLAEALRKSYRFTDAIDYYRRFTINGGSNDISLNDIEKRVSECENGNFMLKYIYGPEVIDRKSASATEFLSYFSITPDGLSLVPKPKDLLTSTDRKQNDNTAFFYPKNPKISDYIYYSSYGSNTTNGKDIHRTQLLDDGFWSKPENLGDVINTPHDEDFPYLASDGVTLYFSSKGHYSMGGFDLYRSVYNPATRMWSNPENLGFPFSSPFDDILYVVDEKDSLSCFATNRNVLGDSLEVVLVKISKNPIRKAFSTIGEVENLAKLIPAKMQKSQSNTSEKKTPPIAASKVQPLKVLAASFNSVENDPEYMRVIAQGFIEQMKTDSLRLQLEKLRGRFDYITTADERRKLEAQVVSVEDAMLAAQHEADNMFTRASQIEQEYLTGKRKPIGKPNQSFMSDNPEFLYQAQFAPTVFRSDEIQKLAQIENLHASVETAREETVSARDSHLRCLERQTALNCDNPKRALLSKMNAYNELIAKIWEVKYKLYNDCVLVALVKSKSNNGDDARAEIARAQSHFRAAITIRNNLGAEGRTESLYESSLLNELGLLRLEIAFAKIWGMTLFEQAVTSKALRIEKIAFGSALPPLKRSNRDDALMPAAGTSKETVGLYRTETVSTPTPILFKQDESATFQILDKATYSSQNPIPVDEPLPDGILYRIQLVALGTPPEFSFFKGIVPISGEKVTNGKVTKYYAGKFFSFAEAEKALAQVKAKGFRDAFVVSWFNGKPITLSRAQSIEREQPLKGKSSHDFKPEKSTDLNIVYLVQVGKYSGRLPEKIAQTIRAIAPGKDIVRKPGEEGKEVYSISSFNNIDEATRVKDSLIASGIPGVTVITLELTKK